MYTRDLKISVRRSLTLLVAASTLAGCLSGESDSGGLTGGGGTAPTQNTPPTISGSPSSAVLIGDAYAFTPSASDADGDAITFSVENLPSWADFDTALGSLTGRPTLANVGLYENIRISASDGQASGSLPVFSISVEQSGDFSTTLSWVAPSLNEDGSDLTDLAGYKVYWGTTAGQYTNSVQIDNPTVTTYVVENLTAGTYEFVTTAFNLSGEESGFSNPATRVLQ